MSKFRRERGFDQRKQEATTMLERYPDRVPVIVERDSKSLLPLIDRNKFLVPSDLTAYHFTYIIRKRMNLQPSDALFLFIEGKKILKGDQLIAQVYQTCKNEDNFLYIVYKEETVLGSSSLSRNHSL